MASVLVFLLAGAGSGGPWGDSAVAQTHPRPVPTVSPKVDLEPLKLDARERQAICKKYEGQLIGYYGSVYRVRDCRRIPVPDSDSLLDATSHGAVIHEVDSRVVVALTESSARDQGRVRDCKALGGRYITTSFVDVYWVEGCNRRLFPDWETYIQHRADRKKESEDILTVTRAEFRSLKRGPDMPSAIDARLAKTSVVDREDLDILPVDEACKGINNSFRSYHSRMYRIENCRKREISPDALLDKTKFPNAPTMEEMSSQQWRSLPDGEKM